MGQESAASLHTYGATRSRSRRLKGTECMLQPCMASNVAAMLTFGRARARPRRTCMHAVEAKREFTPGNRMRSVAESGPWRATVGTGDLLQGFPTKIDAAVQEPNNAVVPGEPELFLI